MHRFVVIFVLAVLTVSCQRKTFQVKGVIKEISTNGMQAQIEHENIPGYMEAMTMMFDVKNSNELAGLAPYDQISFRMIVTKDDGWIDQIKKIGTVTPTNTPPTFRRVREVEPLQVGDLLPEYKFTNELGKAVSLGDYKGKAVAITFIFTRCPFPVYCPRMAGHFKKTYELLKEKSDAPKNWHLLALTIDPDFDTPAVLKDYAKRYEYDPEKWNFLTGEHIDITAITEQFGLLYWRPDPNQPLNISHNLRTVVIDVNGRVHKVLPENKWEPPELVETLIQAARVPPPTAAR